MIFRRKEKRAIPPDAFFCFQGRMRPIARSTSSFKMISKIHANLFILASDIRLPPPLLFFSSFVPSPLISQPLSLLVSFFPISHPFLITSQSWPLPSHLPLRYFSRLFLSCPSFFLSLHVLSTPISTPFPTRTSFQSLFFHSSFPYRFVLALYKKVCSSVCPLVRYKSWISKKWGFRPEFKQNSVRNMKLCH